MFCGKCFRDTVWNGDHAMKISILSEEGVKRFKNNYQ